MLIWLTSANSTDSTNGVICSGTIWAINAIKNQYCHSGKRKREIDQVIVQTLFWFEWRYWIITGPLLNISLLSKRHLVAQAVHSGTASVLDISLHLTNGRLIRTLLHCVVVDVAYKLLLTLFSSPSSSLTTSTINLTNYKQLCVVGC